VPPLMRAILPSSLAMKFSCLEWIVVSERDGGPLGASNGSGRVFWRLNDPAGMQSNDRRY
jgi:hypothetical protein